MASTQPQFDITVIGAGAGGLAAAITGATLGLRVALVERERLGGECLWTGCVPSKALLHAADLAQAAREATRWNGNDTSAPPLDFQAVIRHVHAARTTIEASENQEDLDGRASRSFVAQPASSRRGSLRSVRGDSGRAIS